MRRLLLVAAAAAVLLLPALPAAAHASLVETEPPDGASLGSAPDRVTLTFSEPVDVPVGGVRVFDGSGRRVDLGDAAAVPGAPEKVTVSLGDDVPPGVLVATWRAVSLDAHPINGAFVFQVGSGQEPIDRGAVAGLLGQGDDPVSAVASTVVRWIAYSAGLIAAGAVLFLLVVDRPAPAGVRRLVRWAATVGVVASILQVPLFAAEATGLGLGVIGSGPAIADALASPVAGTAVVRTLGLLALLLLVHRPRLTRGAGVAALVVPAADLLSGHTLTTEPAALVMASDLVHMAAAALWMGGLAALPLTVREARRDDRVSDAAHILRRFSSLALWSVVALVLAGLALAWTQVRAPRALTSTDYGLALLMKTGLAVLVLGFAAYNRRVLVPSITARAATARASVGAAVADTTAGEWQRLSRIVRLEVIGLVAVLGVTAVLVNLRPAAEEAGITGVYSTYLPFGDGQLNLVVDPNRVGVNQIHLYTLTAAGLPGGSEGEASLELRLPEQEIGPIVRTPQPAGPGHWVHTGPELAIAGAWEVTFRLVDGFEERTATAEVVVNP